MKRIVMWLASTVTVVVLLFGYHTSTSGPQRVATAQVSTPIAGSSSTDTSSTSTTEANPLTSTDTTPKSTPEAAPATTIDGDSVNTEWGPVQVQITVTDGKITEVNMLDYPYENRKDQEINTRALPVLIQGTLDAQSANVDMVSGATVTSNGYRESLQSAIDQAGL